MKLKALITIADVQDCLHFILFVYIILQRNGSIFLQWIQIRNYVLLLKYQNAHNIIYFQHIPVFTPLTANWKFKLGTYLKIECKE